MSDTPRWNHVGGPIQAAVVEAVANAGYGPWHQRQAWLRVAASTLEEAAVALALATLQGTEKPRPE
jgi:hypothetical protein